LPSPFNKDDMKLGYLQIDLYDPYSGSVGRWEPHD
jgi:hypothetical protein